MPISLIMIIWHTYYRLYLTFHYTRNISKLLKSINLELRNVARQNLLLISPLISQNRRQKNCITRQYFALYILSSFSTIIILVQHFNNTINRIITTYFITKIIIKWKYGLARWCE